MQFATHKHTQAALPNQSEYRFTNYEQLKIHMNQSESSIPSHCLVLVVSRLASIDGLRVSSIPRQSCHIPGDDFTVTMLTYKKHSYLGTMIGLTLWSAVTCISSSVSSLRKWGLWYLYFSRLGLLQWNSCKNSVPHPFPANLVCVGDWCLIPLITPSSSMPPIAL